MILEVFQISAALNKSLAKTLLSVVENRVFLELFKFHHDFSVFIMVIAKLLQGYINITNDLTVDHRIQRDFLETDSLIVFLDHVLQYQTDQSIEAVLYC